MLASILRQGPEFIRNRTNTAEEHTAVLHVESINNVEVICSIPHGADEHNARASIDHRATYSYCVFVFENFPPNARGGGLLGTRVPRREREREDGERNGDVNYNYILILTLL